MEAVRDELTQVESRIVHEQVNLAELRRSRQANEERVAELRRRGRREPEWEGDERERAVDHGLLMQLQVAIGSADKSIVVSQARLDALVPERERLAGLVAQVEARPEVRDARKALAAAGEALLAADAGAVEVLKKDVLPAIDRLRSEHASVVRALVAYRAANATLAAARREAPDPGALPTPYLIFANLPLLDSVRGIEEFAEVPIDAARYATVISTALARTEERS